MQVPKEIKWEILKLLEVKDILSWSSVNKGEMKLLDEEGFWRLKGELADVNLNAAQRYFYKILDGNIPKMCRFLARANKDLFRDYGETHCKKYKSKYVWKYEGCKHNIFKHYTPLMDLDAKDSRDLISSLLYSKESMYHDFIIECIHDYVDDYNHNSLLYAIPDELLSKYFALDEDNVIKHAVALLHYGKIEEFEKCSNEIKCIAITKFLNRYNLTLEKLNEWML